jgi:4-alpha-glucanotransferase
MAQIYSVRSRRSWGIGDLADLADLAAWSGHELGADFVLVNPLHSAAPLVPMTPSPYLPATRRFPNPNYLRIEDIPEYAYLSGSERKAVRRLGKLLRTLTPDLLDRDAVWEAKSAALDIVRRVPLSPGRQARYDAYVEREGVGLIDFATWCALAEERGTDWREWPEALRHPSSPEIAAWRADHADRIERHLWMQWLLDEQMERTQESAVEVGMRAGIIHDLAVGVASEGADAWVSPWAVLRICTTSSARTGRSHRGAPTRWPMRRTCPIATCCAPCCVMREASVSITSWDCSVSGGSRRVRLLQKVPTSRSITRPSSESLRWRRIAPGHS